MPRNISQSEYDYLYSKYNNLVLKAATRISGDLSRSVEDYAQDMWMLIITDMPKYLEKTGLTVEEFCSHPEYSKYVKMWIWTYKNRTGAKITERKDLLSASIRLDRDRGERENSNQEDMSLELKDQNDPSIPSMLAELREGADAKSLVLSAVAFSPDTVNDQGNFNRFQISKHTNLSPATVGRAITEIYKEFTHAIKGYS